MGSNRTPIDKTMTIEKAIKQGGYYNTDHDWNNIITMGEYPGKLLRGRVETLVLKDGKLFMTLKNSGNYRIPGGGFDKGVLDIDQAFMETKEEAKLIIHNIRYSGVTYVKLWDEIWGEKEGDIPYHGTVNKVYIADYKEDFHGYIRKGLSDMDMTKNGQFYDLQEVESILKEPHKQALKNILYGHITESSESSNDEYMYSSAKEFQTYLKDRHKYGYYNCIHNIDVESDDGGYVFAQYITNNNNEIKEVKDFVRYCKNRCAEIETEVDMYAYIDEPVSYKGNGFLFIKPKEKEDIKEAIVIDESTIFKNDKVYNLDDFIEGKSNTLLITGLSGSGKTTMAYDLAKQYNAKVIQLDYFQNYNHLKDKYKNDYTIKLIKEFMDFNPDIKQAQLTDITIENYGTYFRPFFFWLLDKLKKRKEKFIIEGMHLILFTKFSEVKSYPLICIESTITKSIIRHWIRDEWSINDIIRSGYKDINLFFKWNEEKYRFFNEASTNQEDKYPIFIVNTYTGTPFGKVIKTYIHSNYTHSALSLDTSLENLYSFNGKNGVNKKGGFSKEKLSSYINYNNDCRIKVNCIFVTKNDLDKIKKRLDYMTDNQKITTYGFSNLFNIIRNKSIETGKDATSMVCSQFVSYILSVADIKLLDKSINLITPKDLSTLTNPTVYLLFEGYGRDYDKKKIDRIFRKLKVKSHLVKHK